MKDHRLKLTIAAVWLLACLALRSPVQGQSATVPNAPAAPTVEKPPAPTAAEMAAWASQLDDRQYRVREQATRQLLAAGSAAVEMLLEVANGDRPEPSDRALWVLQQFGNSKDALLRRTALETLTRLKKRPQVVAAANDALAVMRHQESRAAIVQLGGQFQADEVPGIDPRLVSIPLILDDKWKGKHEDLAHLSRVLGLRRVVIIGTEISTADVAQLQRIPALEELYLYGTRLEPADVASLKEALPQATIDYRRGALLGVSGNRFNDAGPAKAEIVQPGSAAAAAGIHVGDVIRKFDGQDVTNFKDLTEKISTRHPGEEVSLEIVRNGATKKFTLKLGQWSTEHLLRQVGPR